jgi:hypothetical protein
MRDNKEQIEMLEHKVFELTDTINDLADENDRLKDIIASQQWEATPFEKDYILTVIQELRQELRVRMISEQAAIDSRDMFQNRNAELLKTISVLKKKLQ